MSDDAITEADVVTVRWAANQALDGGSNRKSLSTLANKLDRLRARQCPLGLDATPSICSAGTCAACVDLDRLRAQQDEPPPDEESICATCEGSGCACHPGGRGHPKGLIGWSPCWECGGSGRSAETASRVANPFLDLGEPAAPFRDREPQPSDGPDYHADYAAWVERVAARATPAPGPDEDTEPLTDDEWNAYQAAISDPDEDTVEREMGRVIDQRDNAEEWADRLAEAIATLLGIEIGEHSNLNNPWAHALAAVPPPTRPDEDTATSHEPFELDDTLDRIESEPMTPEHPRRRLIDYMAGRFGFPPPARPEPQTNDDGSIPPCSDEASLCGGTPGDCWNHVAVDGRCYRADAALDETPIGVIARHLGLHNAVALLASFSEAGLTVSARPDYTEDAAMQVLIHRDPLDGGFWTESPELPGCFSQGDTISEAVEHMAEAIVIWSVDNALADRLEAGE